MQYVLILKNGKTMSFFIKDVADLYRNLYGGVVQSVKSTAPANTPVPS